MSQLDEFLNLLFWTAEKLSQPTFHNWNESYAGWAYRRGLVQLDRMEKAQLVECNAKADGDRMYRLTSNGRLRALGGRDPLVWWNRKWDGRWRLVLFDVPNSQNSHRKRLRRYLQQKGFGYLQKSVWVTPHSIDEQRETLRGGAVNVESMLFLDAHPCAGESDADIVNGAWDFKEINRRYAQHLKLLNEQPKNLRRNGSALKEWRRWAAVERETWLYAMAKDPLLPQKILPPDYLGKQSWQARIEVLGKMAKQIAS